MSQTDGLALFRTLSQRCDKHLSSTLLKLRNNCDIHIRSYSYRTIKYAYNVHATQQSGDYKNWSLQFDAVFTHKLVTYHYFICLNVIQKRSPLICIVGFNTSMCVGI